MAFACARGSGHPDEACDRVATAIVEEYVRRDPSALCDIRVMGGHGILFVSGEVKTAADFDVAAVVRRSIGEIDPALSLEPFVSIERMDGIPSIGTSEAVSVFGYACDETPERLPVPVALVRRALAELERLRLDDADWFWCGADMDVSVLTVGATHASPVQGIVRISHIPSIALEDVRARVSSILSEFLPTVDWRVNPAGPDMRGGLAGRVGASRQPVSGGLFGSLLPSVPSASGRHPSHPLRRGADLARAAAIELVDAGLARAAWVELVYPPLETRPSSIRIRNERGQDLSAALDPSQFSL